MSFVVTRRRFSIEQIEAALRQAQAGTPEAELIRRLGICELTFCRWKKLYGRLPSDLSPVASTRDPDRHSRGRAAHPDGSLPGLH